MPTLEIQNTEVELGGAKIVFNKSSYSVSDWVQKQITYSERVTIPRVVFMKFNETYSFKYKDNGKITTIGVAKLSARNSNFTDEILLNDTSKALFDATQNDLTSLDLDIYDFVFNTASYNTLKTLTSSIWIWSAASMHEVRELSKNILSGNLAFSRPFFSVRRLLELIFSSQSWQYNLSANCSFVDNLIISSNSDSFSFTSYEKLFSGLQPVSGSYSLDLTSPNFIKTDSLSGSNTLLLNFDTKMRFRGWITSDVDMEFQITGVSSSATNSQSEKFQINKGTFFYDYTSKKLKTSDTTFDVVFSLLGSGNVTFDDFRVYTLIDENDFGAMSAAGFTDFLVKTYDNIPEISQTELYKNAIVFVGGFFTTDNFRKIININSLNEISKLSSLDWSGKFIEDSDKETQLSGYGKINYFSYDNDNTKPNALGRGTFEIENQTYKDTATVYKSIFAASEEVEITDAMIDITVYDDTERIEELTNIIGYYEEIGAYTVARFENLNGNTIFANYYENFILALKRGQLIEAEFDINKSDFFTFSFLRMIYIEKKKSSYYVLSMKNYTEGRTTKLTLLKS